METTSGNGASVGVCPFCKEEAPLVARGWKPFPLFGVAKKICQECADAFTVAVTKIEAEAIQMCRRRYQKWERAYVMNKMAARRQIKLPGV